MSADFEAQAKAFADQIEAEAFSHLSDEDFDELRRLLRVQLNAVRGEPEEKKAAAAAS